MGFAVFTIASIFLAVTWFDGTEAALWLIGWRVVQGVGGAFLMANSSAILTDAFPADQRGLALGINGVAAIAGSFLGLLIGGILAPIHWNLIFLVSVPFGVVGTIWAYLKLRDTGVRRHADIDWWGNITFAVGLIAVLVGITYGIQPYGSSSMGWGSRWCSGASSAVSPSSRSSASSRPRSRIPSSTCICSRSSRSPGATSPTWWHHSAAAVCSSS